VINLKIPKELGHHIRAGLLLAMLMKTSVNSPKTSALDLTCKAKLMLWCLQCMVDQRGKGQLMWPLRWLNLKAT